MFKKKYSLGLIGKDPFDPRLYQLSNIQPKIVSLPKIFDLRPQMSPVIRQNWGSCWAASSTAVKEYLDSVECGKNINLSEKFVYYTGKKISGLYNIEGDYIISALKALCLHGAPLIEDYPDTSEKDWKTYINTTPPLEIYEKAKKYRGKTYWAVRKSLEDFRQSMYQQKAPIVFGMRWFESYNKTNTDGSLPLPGGKDLGGHCLAIAGFLEDRLIIKNSFGTGYGDNGYIYIPFNEFDKHDIWNAYVLLDLPRIEGYVANKYIKKIQDFTMKNGDLVRPITNLNLRQQPTVNSKKVVLLSKNDRLTIMNDEIINADGYSWQKVKKI